MTFVATIILLFAAAGRVVDVTYFDGPFPDESTDPNTSLIVNSIANWGSTICFCVLAAAVVYVAWSVKTTKCIYWIKGQMEKQQTCCCEKCES